MAKEGEPKEVTIIKKILRGMMAASVVAVLSTGDVRKEPVPPIPIETPSPTPQPTLTPESTPTPTPEITRIAGLTITADYLKQAFAGIGGEEVITNGQKEVSMVQFGQEYVSQSWGQEINFANLPQSPINSLKYLVSLGAYQGQEGVFTPGRQGEEIIFPQLKDLSLPRLTLEKIPLEGEQKEQEFPQWVSPQGLLLRPDTQMTVIGLLNQPQPEGTVAVDKDALGGELNYALVAFTDYLRVSEEGIPRHYLAILPTHFSADPENKNALSLKNLLETNGYSYDPQTNEITLTKDNLPTILSLNQIEGEELTKDLRQATGLAFVDQMKGELIKNPVVPYHEEMPAVWELNREEDEEGKISFLLQEENDQGEMVPYAQAFYDEEKEGWEWQEILSAEEKLAQVPQIEGLKALWQEEKIIYQAEANNPYGLEEGEYAGEFVPNVTMETEEGKEETTGGLVLTAPVVLAELNQQLAKIPEQDDRWLIPLPVDIRGLEGISITFGKDEIRVPVVKIVYPGSAPLVNIIPEADKLCVGKTFLGDWIYYDHMCLIEPYTDPIYPGLEMRYLTVRGNFLGFRENITLPTTFGAKIGKARKPIYVMMEAATDIRPVTPDKILCVDQTPVFVAANTP